jgi:ribonuclease HI
MSFPNGRASTPIQTNNIFLQALAPASSPLSESAVSSPSTFALPGFGVAAPSTRVAPTVILSRPNNKIASTTTTTTTTDETAAAADDTFVFEEEDLNAPMPETTVYVDGSFFEQTRQAGCGIYYSDERAFAMPFAQAPLSSLRAELCAAITAARLFLQDPVLGERVTSQRRLIIKQDCSKATNMILACKKEIKYAQIAQRQYHQNVLHKVRRLRDVQSMIARTKKEQKEGNTGLSSTEASSSSSSSSSKTTSNTEADASSALEQEAATLASELAALGPLGKPIPTGVAPPPLADLLSGRPLDSIVYTHDKYTVTIGELVENLDLLEPLLSLMRIFPIRLEHVKAHQERPPDHKVQELRNWQGNNFADALAKQGSRSSTLHLAVV